MKISTLAFVQIKATSQYKHISTTTLLLNSNDYIFFNTLYNNEGGQITFSHNDQLFQLEGHLLDIFDTVLTALVSTSKGGIIYRSLELNTGCTLRCTSTLYNKERIFEISLLGDKENWDYSIGIAPEVTLKYARFPMQHFAKAFLPVVEEFLQYQQKVADLMSYEFVRHAYWDENIADVIYFIDKGRLLPVLPYQIEIISNKISTLKTLSTRRPLLVREKIELDFLQKIAAADDLDILQSIENEVNSTPTDPELIKQLLHYVSEKKGFY